MKFFVLTLAFLSVLSTPVRTHAQEPELVSEIVARVNNDIITRADYLNALRDLRERIRTQLSQQGKGEAEINSEYERIRPTILSIMIEDLLLEQKAKELGIEVEAEVNQQMIEIAKENGFKNLIDFENAIKKQGIDPEAARSSLRRPLLQQSVVQREVLIPIYHGINEKERREFYDKNKEMFTVPGKVTLSEIFLPLEGHTAADVEQRARRLTAELRAGLSFVEAVRKHSPSTRPSRAQDGKLGEFLPTDLKKEVAAAISTLNIGEVTEPIRLQDGYQILRVDEKKPSVLRQYGDKEVENYIGRAITMQRAEEARKKYIEKLKEEAYIKISKEYAPAETPSSPKAQG